MCTILNSSRLGVLTNFFFAKAKRRGEATPLEERRQDGRSIGKEETSRPGEDRDGKAIRAQIERHAVRHAFRKMQNDHRAAWECSANMQNECHNAWEILFCPHGPDYE